MSDYLQHQLQNGSYDFISRHKDFAKRITLDVLSIYTDGHFSVFYSPKMAERLVEFKADNGEKLMESRQANFGVEKVEMIKGGFGYIKIDQFFPVNSKSKKAVKSAISVVAGAKTLIIDLRSNRVASREWSNLYSGFYLRRQHISMIFMNGERQGLKFTTSSDGSFPILFRASIFILTSKATFSAGEEMAYYLQALKCATIVEEVTGGGANPLKQFNVGKRFIANIPYQRAINPVTKMNWEGIGVMPDIVTPKDLALKKVMHE